MSASLKNTAVLVVDDNSDICDLLRTVLEGSGASVAVAYSVDAALEAFRRSPPHVVIADIRLRNSDGYALMDAIRHYNAEYKGFTPAIAVTGFASPEDEERALGAGFAAYISKPFDPAEVVRAVARAMGREPTDRAA
jgi:CheY-like chemotaxis protein